MDVALMIKIVSDDFRQANFFDIIDRNLCC